MNELFTTWGKEILSTFLLLPLAWYFIRSNSKNHEKTVEQFSKLSDAFIKHTQEDGVALEKIHNAIYNHNENSTRLFNKIIENVHKTLLEDEQTVRIFKADMWLTSRKKLSFIKNILLNNHIKGREEFIYEKVKLGLLGYSDEYLANFKGFNTPVGCLAQWLEDNFTDKEFEQFVKEIVDIMFREDDIDKIQSVNDKMNEISLIMETLQSNLANKLKKDIANLKIGKK